MTSAPGTPANQTIDTKNMLSPQSLAKEQKRLADLNDRLSDLFSGLRGKRDDIISGYERKIQDLNKQLLEAGEVLHNLEADIAERDAAIQKLEIVKQNLEASREDLQKVYESKERQCEDLVEDREQKVSRFHREIQLQVEKLSEEKAKNKEMTKELKEVNKQLNSASQKLEKAIDEKSEAINKAKQLEENLDFKTKELNAQIEKLEHDLKEKDEENASRLEEAECDFDVRMQLALQEARQLFETDLESQLEAVREELNNDLVEKESKREAEMKNIESDLENVNSLNEALREELKTQTAKGAKAAKKADESHAKEKKKLEDQLEQLKANFENEREQNVREAEDRYSKMKQKLEDEKEQCQKKMEDQLLQMKKELEKERKQSEKNLSDWRKTKKKMDEEYQREKETQKAANDLAYDELKAEYENLVQTITDVTNLLELEEERLGIPIEQENRLSTTVTKLMKKHQTPSRTGGKRTAQQAEPANTSQFGKKMLRFDESDDESENDSVGKQVQITKYGHQINFDEIKTNGQYIKIKNESEENVSLTGWSLKCTFESEEITFTFDDYELASEDSVAIVTSSDYMSNIKGNKILFETEPFWAVDNGVVELYDDRGDVICSAVVEEYDNLNKSRNGPLCYQAQQ